MTSLQELSDEHPHRGLKRNINYLLYLISISYDQILAVMPQIEENEACKPNFNM
jgi:hypothetical protein